jgi:hypothetical protein
VVCLYAHNSNNESAKKSSQFYKSLHLPTHIDKPKLPYYKA